MPSQGQAAFDRASHQPQRVSRRNPGTPGNRATWYPCRQHVLKQVGGKKFSGKQAIKEKGSLRNRAHQQYLPPDGFTLPGIAYYCGSKFALEGVSEVLAKEVESFGVHVTAMAPGSFRTDWAGRSMVRSGRSLSEYDTVFDPVRKAREDKSGKQAGDPHKAAQALLALVATENPPVHLLLGGDAVRRVREKIARLQAEIDAWEYLSESTDFD